jgi:hypothetical protein
MPTILLYFFSVRLLVRTFSSWEGDKYDTQLYTGGARCWNGPERSAKVKENKQAKFHILMAMNRFKHLILTEQEKQFFFFV